MQNSELPEGVIIRKLGTHSDSRGHLQELFRSDELPSGLSPEMGYISVTLPGVARGPHEHRWQTDIFCFTDGVYELRLWENRPGLSPQYIALQVGSENPTMVVVPPGVVHGYKNIGSHPAFVLNFPDKLYAGKDRGEPVDEIRHESEDHSPFRMN